jgi:HEAT repeat protein
MTDGRSTRRALAAALGLAIGAAGMAAGQTGGVEPLLAELRNPSARARVKALESLSALGRPDVAAPMASLLADENTGVQSAAINGLLTLFTVRVDLRQRQWGPGSVGRSSVPSEVAFEAGPLATLPAPVPAEALTGLARVARQDESLKTRLDAAYTLGTIGAPAMGPMPRATADAVASELVAALQHPDPSTRQVLARVAGRVFTPAIGAVAPTAVGDALIIAMNDADPLVRRWAMDSLGWMRYDRAVQSLTERASYYGKSEEGSAALHALARIAAAPSAPVFQALLSSSASTFRVISIEGLARIGDRSALPAIAESASSSRQVNVVLAARLAEFLLGQSIDLSPIVTALRNEETAIQGRVYLAEIVERQPQALHALLQSPEPWVRRGTVELLGASRRPAEDAAIQPMLKDPAREVVEAASEAIYRLRGYAAVAATAPTNPR